MKTSFLLGVDEAGRGPLAGPVAVGVVKVPKHFNFTEHFPDAADSKVLSEAKREEIYAKLVSYKEQELLDFTVLFSPPARIDAIGITGAVRAALYKGVQMLAPEPAGVEVLLDGLLSAPPEFMQETIIRGDATEPVISLASIAAKVERDRLMIKLAKKYREYGFERHKGYGTKLHYDNILKYGLCNQHRISYLKRYMV